MLVLHHQGLKNSHARSHHNRHSKSLYLIAFCIHKLEKYCLPKKQINYLFFIILVTCRYGQNIHLLTWFENPRYGLTAVSTITEADTFWTIFWSTHQTRMTVVVRWAVAFIDSAQLFWGTATIPIASKLIPGSRITLVVSSNCTFTFISCDTSNRILIVLFQR